MCIWLMKGMVGVGRVIGLLGLGLVRMFSVSVVLCMLCESIFLLLVLN